MRLPGFEFGIEYPESAYRQALLERFPGQRDAIERWFGHCEAARKACCTLMACHNLPPVLAWGLRLLRGTQAEAWRGCLLADELREIGDPRLRAVLGARWGDYGAPPESAPFIEHA